MKTLFLIFISLLIATHAINGQCQPEPDSIEIDPTAFLYKMMHSKDAFEQLKGISLLIAYYKDKGDENRMLEIINRYTNDGVSKHPGRVLYWLGDYHMDKGEYDKAELVYDKVFQKYKNEMIEKFSCGEYALEGKAEAQYASKRYEQAISTFNELIDHYPKSEKNGWYQYRIANAYRSTGNLKKSNAALNTVIKNYSKDMHPYIDETLMESCKRELSEIKKYALNPSFGYKDKNELIDVISKVLLYKDIDSLSMLVKENNFWWSIPGTEPLIMDFLKVKQLITEAFKDGNPAIPEPRIIKDHQSKIYLYSNGWKSKYLSEELWIILRKEYDIWFLQGFLLNEPRPVPESWQEKEKEIVLLANKSSETNTNDAYYDYSSSAFAPSSPALRFTLKAPWKSGSYMSSGKLASMFCGNSCANICGWNGYYYGQGGHTGNHYYSIDFTYWNNSWPQAGRNVMSVASGIVYDRKSSNGQVWIRHLSCGAANDGYRSTYAHMRNIRVSIGQYVARGSWIGEVDDVGHSTGNHLHFTLYDYLENGGRSVRPSPMEGKARNLKGVSRCIRSSNSSIWSDSDGDGVPNVIDNCPYASNYDQRDFNNNCRGDVCEDSDADGIMDFQDNCKTISNPDQSDIDSDGIGDICDSDMDNDRAECRFSPMGGWICDGVDNCIEVPNPDQSDNDGDGLGDACDDDDDNDGVLDEDDFCPYVSNSENLDSDFDNLGDVCDNCPYVYNPDQLDANNDGEGNACDSDDTDNDGIADKDDNCPEICNNDQKDSNGDGIGDACTSWSFKPGVVPGTSLTAIRDAIEIAIKFESMEQRHPIPIGPICLTCPPDDDIKTDIVFPEFHNDLKYEIFNRHGQLIPSDLTFKNEKVIISFIANPRSEYFMIISPLKTIKFDKMKEYKINMRLEF